MKKMNTEAQKHSVNRLTFSTNFLRAFVFPCLKIKMFILLYILEKRAKTETSNSLIINEKKI